MGETSVMSSTNLRKDVLFHVSVGIVFRPLRLPTEIAVEFLALDNVEVL